jgi:hypothetical protein
MMPFSKRHVIIAALGLLAIVAGIIYLLWDKRPTEVVDLKSTGVRINHSLTASALNENLLLNTNRNFVKFNPKTKTSQLLMAEGLLPDIDGLNWSDDQARAFFTTSGQTEDDMLGKILYEQDVPTRTPFVWLADFSAKKYVPIGSDVVSVGWTGATTFFVAGRPSGKTAFGLYTADARTLEYKLVFEQQDLLAAYATKGGFLLYSAPDRRGILTRYATSGGQKTKVLENLTRAPLVNRDGSLIVGLVNTEVDLEDPDFSKDDMMMVEASTGKVIRKLASKQAHDGAWSVSGSDYYYKETSSGLFLKASHSGDNTTVSKLALPKDLQAPIARFLGSARALYAIDANGRLYSTFANQSAVSAGKDLSGSGFEVYYYPDPNSYGISASGDAKSRALVAMKQAGINPDLADIVYEDEYNPDRD